MKILKILFWWAFIDSLLYCRQIRIRHPICASRDNNSFRLPSQVYLESATHLICAHFIIFNTRKIVSQLHLYQSQIVSTRFYLTNVESDQIILFHTILLQVSGFFPFCIFIFHIYFFLLTICSFIPSHFTRFLHIHSIESYQKIGMCSNLVQNVSLLSCFQDLICMFLHFLYFFISYFMFYFFWHPFWQ